MGQKWFFSRHLCRFCYHCSGCFRGCRCCAFGSFSSFRSKRSFCRCFLFKFVSGGILGAWFCCSFEIKYGIKHGGVGPWLGGRGGGGAGLAEADGGLQQEGGERGGGRGVRKLGEEVLRLVSVFVRGCQLVRAVPDSDDDVTWIFCLWVWPRSPGHKILAANWRLCDKNRCRGRGGRLSVAAGAQSPRLVI